jgi:hypothetical protein
MKSEYDEAVDYSTELDRAEDVIAVEAAYYHVFADNQCAECGRWRDDALVETCSECGWEFDDVIKMKRRS